MLTGKEVVVESGTNAADMQRSRWAWSETNPHFLQFIVHSYEFIVIFSVQKYKKVLD